MPVISADTGDQNLVDDGHATAFHMQTIANLSTDDNTLSLQVHSESHVLFAGFHGAARAFLVDANNQTIYMSQVCLCGTEGKMFAPHGRDCSQVEDVPPALVQATKKVVAIEFHDPHNVILQAVYNLASGITLDGIWKVLETYGPMIVTAITSA